jgi:hypothetical protein
MREARRFALVRSTNLRVVLQLPLAFKASVERLTGIRIPLSIRFKEVTAAVRQNDCLFAVTRDADCLDKALFRD